MNDPKRKTIRLQNYDYSSNGAYFVTICTQDHTRYFWDSNTPQLNRSGEMVLSWAKELPKHFSGVYLDSYAVMPNHVHLVLFFKDTAAALTTAIGWFKTMATNAYIRGVKDGVFPPFQKRLWQRSYYEHVIRNQNNLTEIRRYVAENPLKWQLDKLYKE